MLHISFDSFLNRMIINKRYRVEFMKSDKDLTSHIKLWLYDGEELIFTYRQIVDFFENGEYHFNVLLSALDEFEKLKSIHLMLAHLYEDIKINNKHSQFHDLFDFFDIDSVVLYLKKEHFLIIKSSDDKNLLKFDAFYKGNDNRHINFYNEITFTGKIEVDNVIQKMLNYQSFKHLKINDLRGFFDSKKDAQYMKDKLTETVDKFSHVVLNYLD